MGRSNKVTYCGFCEAPWSRGHLCWTDVELPFITEEVAKEPEPERVPCPIDGCPRDFVDWTCARRHAETVDHSTPLNPRRSKAFVEPEPEPEPELSWEIEFNGGRIWWDQGPRSDVDGLIAQIDSYLDGGQSKRFRYEKAVAQRIARNWLEVKGKLLP